MAKTKRERGGEEERETDIERKRGGNDEGELTGTAVARGTGPLLISGQCTLERPRLAAGVTAHLDDVMRHGDDMCPVRGRRMSAAEHCTAQQTIPQPINS